MTIGLQKKDVITKQQWPLTLYVCWGQNFHATWLYFIGNQYHINIIKSISNPKRAHIQNDAKAHGLKPMAYYVIKAHGLSSWHIISFSAYNPSSWISLGEFGSHGLEDQEVCSIKFQWFKVDKENMLLGVSSPIP